jgi:tetratricopeptide (TPR) repeat protein
MESVQGNVEFLRSGQTQWQPARLNETYCTGDRIQVGPNSRADVYLANQSIIRLDQNTTITLGGLKEERTSLLQLLRGTLYFFSRLPRNLEILTAFVNAGVEGTEGLVSVQADRAIILIFEGNVFAQNQFGSLSLTDGQSAVAEQGRAPVLAVVVRPRDAVQWALYYPPTLHFRPEDFSSGPGWEGMVRSSIEAYLKGDLQAAFESIKGVPDSINEVRFFAYRAALLLAVGRVAEASKDIERALSLRPAYSDALALRSVIAVAQNENAQALESAKAAVSADPKSAGALSALSYAQQANFDLESARKTLRQAVQTDPNNALAWARLAELHMSFAELDDALEAAQRAVALDPNVSRTQTVLGFAYLTQIKTTDAKRAFTTAIGLDQADPLPRLGFGLAIVRDGDLDEGRRQIDIAVSLDPDNSLMRSYLGKAFFEEKRDSQAARQYEMAKQLDPNDPTPYFYDAIRKQTTNRPVEALQDMQKAIELNENRAVYRSRQLLDSDLAARSASQARIYSDLGFQQLALVEGWKSLNTDPTNYSAHRFLADSYSILPRHEIARVSELLQSQLLQPLNTTPIQPRLAESNLFLISAAGPAGLGFNEFHPLFNRNGLNFQTTGLAGENDTRAGESVLSGIYKKASFSLGGFNFRTDGWRENADQKDTIANAFLQLELSPRTSVQTEYRYRNRDEGDIELNFFRDDFRREFREKDEAHSYRFGFRHDLFSSSTMLGSFIHQRRDSGQRFVNRFPTRIVFTRDEFPGQKAFSGELQYLFRSKHVNASAGVGHFNEDTKHALALTIDRTPIGLGILSLEPQRTDEDVKHTNLYFYSNINLSEILTLTVGISADIFKTQSRASDSRNQVNPKFGIAWNPVPDTTFRAGAVRVLKRTLVTDQTLEPTQVSGFNQFFDDLNSTQSWRYAAAVDQKFSHKLFGGIEISRRDLNIPFRSLTLDNDGNVVRDTVERGDGREYMARSYLFFTPHPWMAASAEYQVERFKRESDVAFSFKNITTHRVPLALRFFHPSGLSLFFRTTYVNSSGDFLRRGSTVPEFGSDHFWLVDAGVNYRLPRRYGIFTVGARNLFNQQFRYQETDRNPSILPARGVFAGLTLALP